MTCISRSSDVWTSYFGSMGQYDPTFDLKINVGHCDRYFLVQWFCLYFEDWCMSIILQDYESARPNIWPQTKCRSLWPIFYSPLILPYILTSWYVNIKLRIMSQYDMTFDLKINVGHCDLYFMVQWFYLVSWRLFDVWTSLFGIMSQYHMTFDLKINVGHSPIFHGSVILPYSLKTIWYMNTILWDYESVLPGVWPKSECRSLWSIFHGPVILPYISRKLFSGWTSYVGIMSQYDPMSDLKSWSSDFALYLEDILIHEHHTLGLWVSMTQHLTSK